MALSRPQKSQLSRYKNSEHFRTYLTEKSISETQFLSKGEDEQLSELKSYIKDNNLPLNRTQNTSNSSLGYEALVKKIIDSNTLTSDEKVNKIKDLDTILKLEKLIIETEEKLQSLKDQKKTIEDEINSI